MTATRSIRPVTLEDAPAIPGLTIRHFHDAAMDASNGHNLGALLERLTELLGILGLLLLWTDHEEVEDHHEEAHHDPETGGVLFGLRLK